MLSDRITYAIFALAVIKESVFERRVAVKPRGVLLFCAIKNLEKRDKFGRLSVIKRISLRMHGRQ